MTYLTLGQLNIPVIWIAFFLAILYSDFRNRKGDTVTNRFIEHSLFVYVLVWKLSYMIWSWNDFIKAPLSLVYFDGGLKGHFLAIVAIALLLLRKRQVLVWQEIWHYWARFVALYQIIYYGFSEQWLIVALFLLLLVLVERKYAHWLLIAELLLLVWLASFASAFTIVHIAVIILLYMQTRQAQILAIAAIASLVGMLLGDVEKTVTITTRGTIELPTTEGDVYRFAEQTEKLTVVNFFATWCPPCKAEMPHLQSFAENLPNGVKLIGVNLTARDHGEQALAEFMETYHVTYPVLLDETDAVGTAFQVKSIPTTVLLNRHGEELARIVGPVSEENLRKLIQQFEK